MTLSIANLCLCLFHLLLQARNLLIIHAELAHILLVPQVLLLVALLPLLRLFLALPEAVRQVAILLLLEEQTTLYLRELGRLGVQLNNKI